MSVVGAATAVDNPKQSDPAPEQNDTLGEVFVVGLDKEKYPVPNRAVFPYTDAALLVDRVAHHFTNLWLKHKSHKESDLTAAVVEIAAESLQQIRPFNVDELRSFIKTDNVRRIRKIDAEASSSAVISAEGLAKFLEYPEPHVTKDGEVDQNSDEAKAAHLKRLFRIKDIDIKTARGLVDFFRLPNTQIKLGDEILETRQLLTRNEIRKTLDSVHAKLTTPEEKDLALILRQIEPFDHLLSMGGGIRAYQEQVKTKAEAAAELAGKSLDFASRSDYSFGYRVGMDPKENKTRRVRKDSPHLQDIDNPSKDFAIACEAAMPNRWLKKAYWRAITKGGNEQDIYDHAWQAGVYYAERRMIRQGRLARKNDLFCKEEKIDGIDYYVPVDWRANQVANTQELSSLSQTIDSISYQYHKFLNRGAMLNLRQQFTYSVPTSVTGDKPIEEEGLSIGVDSPINPDGSENERYNATREAVSQKLDKWVLVWNGIGSKLPEKVFFDKIPLRVFGQQLGYKDSVAKHPWVKKDTLAVDPKDIDKPKTKDEDKMSTGRKVSGQVIGFLVGAVPTAIFAAAGAPVWAFTAASTALTKRLAFPKSVLGTIAVGIAELAMSWHGVNRLSDAHLRARQANPNTPNIAEFAINNLTSKFTHTPVFADDNAPAAPATTQQTLHHDSRAGASQTPAGTPAALPTAAPTQQVGTANPDDASINNGSYLKSFARNVKVIPVVGPQTAKLMAANSQERATSKVPEVLGEATAKLRTQAEAVDTQQITATV